LGRTEMSKRELSRVEILAKVKSLHQRLVDVEELVREKCGGATRQRSWGLSSAAP